MAPSTKRVLALQEDCLIDPEAFHEVKDLLGKDEALELFGQARDTLLEILSSPHTEDVNQLATDIHSSCGAFSLFGVRRLRNVLRNMEDALRQGSDVDEFQFANAASLVLKTDQYMNSLIEA